MFFTKYCLCDKEDEKGGGYLAGTEEMINLHNVLVGRKTYLLEVYL
jgi:hypothetical protein